MFPCFSSDLWCVPTTPAAGTAGGAAGWASWQRQALLAPPGWPTRPKLGRTWSLQAGAEGVAGGLANWHFSKITEAGESLVRCRS